MDTDWRRVLEERLADAEFRAAFVARPGHTAALLGVPYSVFAELWAELEARFVEEE